MIKTGDSKKFLHRTTPTFRFFGRIEKSNYYLCYVCLSVRPSVHLEQLGSRRKDSVMKFDIGYVYEPTRCTKFLWLVFYFPLDALHVSDYISLSSGATFIGCTSHLVHAGIYQKWCTAYKSCSWWWTDTVRNM